MCNDAGFLRRAFPTFAALAGNLGWPILQRQLRADFRRSRFFVAQLICLSALGLTLIAVITGQADDPNVTAPQIGRHLFNLFFAVEYLIILVVFPAFSSTAFTEERGAGTMDLLLISTLRPAEIVWGKFLASAVYCILFVVASIPLLSIAFLFGGVRLGEVLSAYAVLVGMTLVVSMLGVSISSLFTANLRSTLSVYAIMLVAIGWSLASALQPGTWSDESGPALFTALLGSGDDDLPLRVGWGLLLGGIVFAFLFQIAANRLRPSSHDRSSALRALTVVAICSTLGLKLAPSLRSAYGSGMRPGEDVPGVVILAALFLFWVALIFPTEDAAVPSRVRRRFAGLRGPALLARVFAPGAFWGTIYTVALALLVCGGLFLVWQTTLEGRARPEISAQVTGALLTLPPYVAALAALGFLLATLDFAPVYARLTVFFAFLITLLLPVIFMVSETADSIWTLYYLSPVTLWASLEPLLPDSKPEYVLYGARAIDIARVLFSLLAIALFATAVGIARRRGYTTLSFGEVRGGDPRRRPPPP